MGERKDYAYGTSRYLRADEMVGKTIRDVIADVEDVQFDEKGVKPVLVLENQEKCLVVGASNFDILAAGISSRTQDWIGHTILLRGAKTRFKGRMVDSIQVSVPKQSKPKQAPTEPDDLEDEIPDDFAA
jgi:hypothetical protein